MSNPLAGGTGGTVKQNMVLANFADIESHVENVKDLLTRLEDRLTLFVRPSLPEVAGKAPVPNDTNNTSLLNLRLHKLNGSLTDIEAWIARIADQIDL